MFGEIQKENWTSRTCSGSEIKKKYTHKSGNSIKHRLMLILSYLETSFPFSLNTLKRAVD